MKKHCKYSDEPLFQWDQILGGSGSCSNCRASDSSCEAYGGASKYGTDIESIAIVSGSGAVGAAAVLGLAYFGLQRRKLKKMESEAQGRRKKMEIEVQGVV
ncbi:hypothetical protein TrLO_g344 [Triparma laevis f. longispina]|nr:hypothetical protein TrLO_g344 [Triparma laevis f. longispina]